jgi:hypothetical protein
MRQFRAHQRDKRFLRFGSEILQARNAGAVNVLAGAMLRRFGSQDRLAECWCQAITSAMRSKRTVGAALRSFNAITRVLEVREPAKPPGPDYAPRISPEVQDPDPLDLSTLNAKEIEQLIADYHARRGAPQAPA